MLEESGADAQAGRGGGAGGLHAGLPPPREPLSAEELALAAADPEALERRFRGYFQARILLPRAGWRPAAVPAPLHAPAQPCCLQPASQLPLPAQRACRVARATTLGVGVINAPPPPALLPRARSSAASTTSGACD